MCVACSNGSEAIGYTLETDACKCSIGYQFDLISKTCTLCSVNYYKDFIDDLACLPCDAHRTTEYTGAVRLCVTVTFTNRSMHLNACVLLDSQMLMVYASVRLAISLNLDMILVGNVQ